MSTDDWRTPTTGEDYFLHQQKRLATEQRRPTPRSAQDLGLGPGIGASAVRLDDLNNVLATFNGYYSAAQGAVNAPNANEAFIGTVVGDAEIGGKQTFTGLTSNTEYTRTFRRSPSDANTLIWSQWSGQRVPPSVHPADTVLTEVPAYQTTLLKAPVLQWAGGGAAYFERSNFGVRLKQPGTYTGHVQVGATWANAGVNIGVRYPVGDGIYALLHLNTYVTGTFYIPLTFWTNVGQRLIEVDAYHIDPAPEGTAPRKLWFRLALTRLGDAT